MKYTLTYLFLLVSFLSLNAQTTRQDSIDVIAKTFRELFKHNASLIKDKASFYYIAFEDSSISTNIDNIVDALKDVSPQVRNRNDYDVLTKAEKEKIKFLSFNISGINFKNSNTANTFCGYYEAELSSSGNVVTFVKKRGKWKFIKNVMWYIS